MLRLFKKYYPIRNALFVLGEGLFIFLAVILASRMLLGSANTAFQADVLLKALLISVICQSCLYYNDLYDLQVTDSLTELGIRLLQALGAAAILLAMVYFVFPGFIIREGIFIRSLVIVVICITSWRIGYTQILRRGLFNQRIIILGSSETAVEVTRIIQEKRDSGYEIASIVAKSEWSDRTCSADLKIICLSSYETLCDIAEEQHVKKIVVALKEKRGAFPIQELLACRVRGIEILEGNTFYEMLSGKLNVDEINPSWLIYSQGFQKPLGQKAVKRTIDLLISSTMLILLVPLIVLVAIVIKLESKGAIIFSQERVGQNRKPYRVHKFRSMRSDAEKHTGPVWAKENDDRVTRFGHFMRKTRIDEIPQLWNVLKGEMSFVGPRPERDHFVQELEEIIPYYGERFSVKPGLTGWAQVSYGYGATIADAVEKLNYDLFYIKNMSILMDIMIVARTVKTVIFGMGR